MLSPSQSHFAGEWLNGVKEGRGKETIGDVIYEGGFAENLVSCCLLFHHRHFLLSQ